MDSETNKSLAVAAGVDVDVDPIHTVCSALCGRPKIQEGDGCSV